MYPTCASQFSVTSGTIFANRKLAVRGYLLAIAIFVNGAKGISALQLGRDLDVQYRTAFVLAHKLREAMGSEMANQTLSGTVEVDGMYIAGYIRRANLKEDRVDRRLAQHQTGKRRVVIVARERKGRTKTTVTKEEADGVAFVKAVVSEGSTPARRRSWPLGALHGKYTTHRITHQLAYSLDGACTNQVSHFYLACAVCARGNTTTSAHATSTNTQPMRHGLKITAGWTMASLRTARWG
jgi:hypothetical protein